LLRQTVKTNKMIGFDFKLVRVGLRDLKFRTGLRIVFGFLQTISFEFLVSTPHTRTEFFQIFHGLTQQGIKTRSTF
jgi:hypothetical protein